jgi:phage gpG-like protein
VSITLKVEGISQLQATFARLMNGVEDNVAKAVTATALEINTDVKKRIQRGPKTGRVYTDIFRMIGGRPVPMGPRAGNNLSARHQASAPGEAPATDTGKLASSLYFQQASKMEATIGSRLAYAYYLEYGTTRIRPRPAWLPATELGQKKLNERVRRAIDNAIRGKR